jgi:heme/copper-type cytochrome/quinol oxidase subunit 4
MFVDEAKNKRIETAIAWAGYSIAVIAVIALLLVLLRQQS